MTSPIDQKWHMLSRSNTNMSTQEPPSSSGPSPKIELTINTKCQTPSNDNDNNKKDNEQKECTCPTCPVHPSKTTKDNEDEQYDSADEPLDQFIRPSRPRRRGAPRRYISPSPPPIRYPPPRVVIEPTPYLTSSTDLLSKLNTHDGVADLPYPSRNSIYLTTYPFTDRDVKKYAWLFAHGIEEQWITDPPPQNAHALDSAGFHAGGGGYYPPAVLLRDQHNRRSRSPAYWEGPAANSELPCAFLSRALDTSVVAEERKDVRFWIVVQSRQASRGTKFLVAESRKAAGIVMFYEALGGNSIVFVGAVLGSAPRIAMGALRAKRVESLEDAERLCHEGIVGIVC